MEILKVEIDACEEKDPVVFQKVIDYEIDWKLKDGNENQLALLNCKLSCCITKAGYLMDSGSTIDDTIVAVMDAIINERKSFHENQNLLAEEDFFILENKARTILKNRS